MTTKSSPHTRAVLQAFLVTFLWSTSWVLVKVGLEEIPALTFSGMRYVMAFIFLLPLAFQPKIRSVFSSLKTRQWFILALQGLVLIALVQGAVYVGLSGLPAATVGLLLNFTSVVVALMSVIWLREVPGGYGWLGLLISFTGALVYFYPVDIPASQFRSLAVVAVAVLGNAGSVVLGRHINHRENIPPLPVTTTSIGIGGMVLLLVGWTVEGLPTVSLRMWIIIGWLALVNTAFAFTLWNRTQRTLPAVESSLINNTMLVQIAMLSWLILGERLTLKQWLGMLLAMLGVAVLQLAARQEHISDEKTS